MKFSYNWLQSFFKKEILKPKMLADILTMHSFEIEEMEKKGSDWVFDIDILPNRGSDCFSHMGVAREISALLGAKFEYSWEKPKEIEEKASDLVSVRVKNSSDCPRYTARVIKNVKVNPSPVWMQKRLKSLGLKPINNIVDVTNYVMLETGQPLHAFDLDEISGGRILVRRAKKREKIITLDNEKYELDRDILVIADMKEPLAIAGIKGGKKAEIKKSTKTVVLESANFNQKIIRRASKNIDLRTDASWRFEHGLDLNLTEDAVNKAASLIAKLSGGKVCRGLVDSYSKKTYARKIVLDLNYVNSLLGMDISKNIVEKILKSLGFKLSQSSKSKFLVEVPSFRLDVLIPEDLIEEIGRIQGYEKIPSVFPKASLIPPEKNLDLFWEEMTKNILKESGFTEIYSTSFINKEEARVFGYKEYDLIETENPISADYQYLRPSLIPKLAAVFKKNQKYFGDIRIFELGKIFHESRTKEKRALSGLIKGDAFFEAKGVIDSLLNKLGVSDVWYDQYKPTPEDSKISIWHAKKSAEIKIGEEEVGFLGEISPRICDALKLESEIVIFDFDFEKLQELVSEEHEYKPISPYPEAVRDIAVLVPRDVLVEDVLNEIYTAGGKLIRDVDLFDIYEGDEISEEKKNLAFHIIYQAEDRTLSAAEIEDIQLKIINSLEEKTDWEVRK